MYRVFGELIEPPDGPDDPDLPAGTVISKLLWQRLRITSADIKHRIAIAARIRPRRSLTGPQLPPELPQLAAAVENGDIDEGHIDAVCKGVDELPSALHHKKDTAERILVRHSKEQDAGFVAKLARDIAEELNPDTVFDEQDRRRRSGLTLGPQRADGMSYLRGWVDPETRAYIETGNAAVRPGRHQPDTPIAETGDQLQMPTDTDTTPTPRVARADRQPNRCPGTRCRRARRGTARLPQRRATAA